MKIIAPVVIGKRHVKRAVGFDQMHHQALGIRPGSGLLLKYFSFVDDPQRLRSGNASLGGAHQGVIAPENAVRVRCSGKCGEVKSHGGKDIEVASEMQAKGSR
jgi:hypothetical protein